MNAGLERSSAPGIRAGGGWGMKEKPAVGRLLFICQVAAQKRKSPDTTPGFINNTLNLFVGVTTSNVFSGFHPRLGARPMRDAVEKLIGDAVAESLLKADNLGGSLHVSEPRGCLVIR